MSETTQTNDDSTDTKTESGSEPEFTPLEANNFIRGNAGGCLIIKEHIQGETVETVFITVNRTYFEVKEFGNPKKCKRHTMSEALHRARENGDSVQLAAYQQSNLDIESAVEFAKANFELDDKDSRAGYGVPKGELDEPDDKLVKADDRIEQSAAPIDTSDRHGGGW